MIREINDLIGTTALIATCIAMLFAVAAFGIANRRKKHHLAMQQHAAAHAAAQMAAPPPRQEAPVHYAPQQAPVAVQPAPSVKEVGESLMYATRPTSSPLFKRLGRIGVEQVTPVSTSAPVVAEEQQKPSWE